MAVIRNIVVRIGADISQLQRQLSQAQNSFTKMGAKLTKIGAGLTAGLSAPLIGLAGIAVKTAANFDEAMSKVQAISGATGNELLSLRDKAKEMGAKTKFSASQAAEAYQYMAMAGWKTTDMLDGIEGIMNLAAASGEDLALVSDIVTDGLTAMGLKAKDTQKFVDVLAAASNSSNTNVAMMGETFQYAAPVAGALGYDIKDLAVAIGLMANAGIKASNSGTSLRAGMINLSAPPKKAAKAMDKYKISLTDAKGEMLPLSKVIEQLRSKLGGLSKIEQTAAANALFGKTAIAGWLSIINAAPADVDKLTKAVQGADGTALKMAETMQDNLAGQIIILKSQLEGLAIMFGEILMPYIKKFVGWVQQLVEKFSKMSPAGQKIVLLIAGIAIVIGPLIMGIGLLVTAIGAIAGAFAALTLPMVAIGLGVMALIGVFILMWKNWDKIKSQMVNSWEWMKIYWTIIWGKIKEIGITVINAIKIFFVGGFNFIRNFISTKLNEIKTAFQMVGMVIGSIVKGTVDRIISIFTEISQLPGRALEWGRNIIKQLGAGIMEKANALKEKIKGIVSSIANFFPHSPAKEGELRFTTLWGQKTVEQIAAGMESVKGKLSNASKNLGNVIGSDIGLTQNIAPNVDRSASANQINITITGNNITTDNIGEIADKLAKHLGLLGIG